jgi:peptidyl-prolyl cis-trans isomerase B (cyclophilin B)
MRCRWARLGVAALVLAFGLVGCGHKQSAAEKPGDPQAILAPGGDAGTAEHTLAVDPVLQQPFAQATVADPPTSDWEVPPNLTMTGKSVGKLYTEVVNRWKDVPFVSPSGKYLAYRATLDTEMGLIEIALRPDLAPNHVRNFVALARAGYYDGLVFERTLHGEIDGQADAKVDWIEAGCPLGTGQIGFGSIGYWLKPELSNAMSHEVGAVGAWHGEGTDMAACKFYINLHPAPAMDGAFAIFGKVTRGLDIAKKIHSLPARNDPDFPDRDRPVKPVVIRKVTIETSEVEKLGPN